MNLMNIELGKKRGFKNWKRRFWKNLLWIL